MSAAIERAQLLLAQARHAQAEEALREALAEDPGHPLALAMLALALLHQDRLNEAATAAEAAVAEAPDSSFPFYVRGLVRRGQHRLEEALEDAQTAIALAPTQTAYFTLLSTIRFQQRRWAEALEAVEEGLSHDPTDEGAINMRAQCLLKLGRREEAKETMIEGLAQHPDAAATHANQGWVLLEAGDPNGALGHFEEALRLDPTSDWAREGVITALKARYKLYSLALRFFSWMGRLSPGQQWAVILGGFIGYRLLRGWASDTPAARPLVVPLTVLYLGFVMLTWIADPLFNMVLRFNRYGRMVLNDREKRGAEVFGAVTATALVLGLAGLAAMLAGSGLATFFGAAAAITVAMLVPLSASFNAGNPTVRSRLLAFTAVLGGMGALYLVALATGLKGLLGLTTLLGVVGFFAFQIYANRAAMRGRA